VPFQNVSVSDEARDLVRGAYDLHVHSAPDVIPRCQTDIEVARAFKKEGLAGFVIKSHYTPTAERASLVQALVPDVEVIGSICLNASVGGLNAAAVEVAARAGAKVVWLPTVDSVNDRERYEAQTDKSKAPFWVGINSALNGQGVGTPPVRVIDDGGEVLPELLEVLSVVAAHNLILATGHLSRTEIFAVVDAALAQAVNRIVITHPDLPAQKLSPRDQAELAERGCWIEHTLNSVYSGKADWQGVIEAVRTVGLAHSFLSSDLGKPSLPHISEGMALFAQLFLGAGFNRDEVHRLTVTNPTQLLAGH